MRVSLGTCRGFIPYIFDAQGDIDITGPVRRIALDNTALSASYEGVGSLS